MPIGDKVFKEHFSENGNTYQIEIIQWFPDKMGALVRPSILPGIERLILKACKLTAAQKKALEAAAENHLGVVEFGGYGTGAGLARTTWDKMMAPLLAAGYIKPYPHGGHEITVAGRRAIGIPVRP